MEQAKHFANGCIFLGLSFLIVLISLLVLHLLKLLPDTFYTKEMFIFLSGLIAIVIVSLVLAYALRKKIRKYDKKKQ